LFHPKLCVHTFVKWQVIKELRDLYATRVCVNVCARTRRNSNKAEMRTFDFMCTLSRSSRASIVIRLRARRPGLISPAGVIVFFSPQCLDWPEPTNPPIQWVPGALTPGVKRLRRKTDHFHLVPRSKSRPHSVVLH